MFHFGFIFLCFCCFFLLIFPVCVMINIVPVPKGEVFYLPQHRTLNPRHPQALLHMQLLELVTGAGCEPASSRAQGNHPDHCTTLLQLATQWRRILQRQFIASVRKPNATLEFSGDDIHPAHPLCVVLHLRQNGW